MPNPYFRFKEFVIHQDACAMKVCTDSCLFGAWTADYLQKNKQEPISILDIGTGTGLLSLMLAQKIPLATIDAIEIEPACFGQSKKNILQSPWSGRIECYNDDVRKFAPQQKYDVIICNPPFYEADLASHDVAKNIAHHSAGLTLESLVIVVKRLLADEGVFAVLLPYHRAQEFEKMAREERVFVMKKMLVRQTYKHSFFRVMFLFSQRIKEAAEDEIIIKGSDNNYSSGFIYLLKDYYLHL